jgi:ATP-dependent RNA helicase DDX31/DBP7
MKKKSEKDRIRRGLNILVATPGRLCDHLDTTIALNLSKIEFLVFDEADRMLDMDFEKKINFIIFKIHESKKKALADPIIPKFKLDKNGEPIEDDLNNKIDTSSKKLDPQTILISATLSSGIKEIARRLNIVDSILIDAAEKKSDLDYCIKNKSLVTQNSDNKEKIALPAGLMHYYMIVPSKLRLICLISLVLDKFIYQTKKTNKLVIFAATNDSVQFHEDILRIFLNRKFNMYLDDEDDLEDSEFLHRKSKNTNNNICELFSLYGNMDQHKRAEILGLN